ncbi:MAG: AraC family transcriptional regulator [Lachnospiraceae bacterium]|nr:AraC family transcriptional regulator [Lachnospiraceae bacterium]
MQYNFYELKEPGVDPARSLGYFFTQLPNTLDFYYYITECGHYYVNQHYFVRRESFPYNIVFLVLDGVLTVEYREHIYHLKKNDIFFMDCTDPHYYHATTEQVEFMFVHFDGKGSHELIRHLLDVQGSFVHHSNNILLRQLIKDTLLFHEQERIESTADTSLRVYKLMTYLQNNSGFVKKDQTPVEKTEAYINAHMNEKITLSDLANESGLSDYYFSRYFKAHTGVSPIEYATMKKLDYAAALLSRTDCTVSEVADQIGYTLRSFINLWTAHYEFSPLKFRKLMNSRMDFDMPPAEEIEVKRSNVSETEKVDGQSEGNREGRRSK